jgi:hypothetical protein
MKNQPAQAQPIYAQYDFQTMEEYFDYILQSKINGQFNQVDSLLSQLQPKELTACITYLQGEYLEGGYASIDTLYCLSRAQEILFALPVIKNVV